jgi:hypothetical protein
MQDCKQVSKNSVMDGWVAGGKACLNRLLSTAKILELKLYNQVLNLRPKSEFENCWMTTEVVG